MHHAILGPGGVGGLLAACLAKTGNRVTVVVRSDRLKDYPTNLHLESPFGQFRVEAEKADVVPAADVLWITVKAPQLEESLGSLRDPNCVRAIVPLLNGIDHVAMLRERYGKSRVIAATIAVESERVAPGQIVHRSPFARLNVSSAGRAVLENTLNALQGLGFTCTFLDDEVTLLWSKLVFLGPIALATTAANKTIGEVAADVSWQSRLEAAVVEACAVARAAGAKVEPEPLIAMIRGLPGHMRSSMQKDVDRGNVPELDAIAGPILHGSARLGVEVPVTKDLVERVKNRAGRQASSL